MLFAYLLQYTFFPYRAAGTETRWHSFNIVQKGEEKKNHYAYHAVLCIVFPKAFIGQSLAPHTHPPHSNHYSWLWHSQTADPPPPEVTECNLFMRNWPISSGTASGRRQAVDGKFATTESFKTLPKGHRLVVVGGEGGVSGWGGGIPPARPHGCQNPLPVRRLIIGHLPAPLRSPAELHLRGSAVYFWSRCCLLVCFHSCSLAVLLPVQRSEIYSWCRGQWFMAGFSRTWAKTGEAAAIFCPDFYILALDLFNEAGTLHFWLYIYIYWREWLRETDREWGI